jgi:hypothetical protein
MILASFALFDFGAAAWLWTTYEHTHEAWRLAEAAAILAAGIYALAVLVKS